MKISTLNGEIPSKKFNYDKRCHKRDTNIYELQQQLCRCNTLQTEVV